MRQDSENQLYPDKPCIQQDPNQKRPAEIGGSVRMPRPVVMAVRALFVIVAMIMIVVMVVISAMPVIIRWLQWRPVRLFLMGVAHAAVFEPMRFGLA